MLRIRLLMSLVLLGSITGVLPIWADEKDDEAKELAALVKKQKAEAEAKFKAANVKMTLGESDGLLVYTGLSEDKSGKLATALQKTHALAAKTLKFDNPPFKGKLSVVMFNENRQYKGFLLDALKRAPQGRETSAMELKGNSPTVLIGPALGEKLTEQAMYSDGATSVAVALINRKAGVGTSALNFQVPEWLAGSFGRVIYARADQTRLANFRIKVKGVYNKTRGEPFKPATVWDAPPIADLDVVQASFVEYLAFGAPSSKFAAFVQAFKPEDDNNTPTATGAITAMEWKVDELEAGWKKWILTGK